MSTNNSTVTNPREVREVMTPREIVQELDKYIIGQDNAKGLWLSLYVTVGVG